MIGVTLGAYVIERELGRGGMGAVYVAVHQLLGQRVAIKVLLPEMSRSADVVKRFWAEARAASASRHAGIIQIFDLGAAHGSTYIAMELLEGETLAAHLARSGRLDVPASLAITRQVASALVAAHAAGVVHRDLKPDNVFLVPDPEIPLGVRTKILDFGISKVAAHHHLGGGGAMTGTGMMLGTPYYMSPEQCRGGGNIDHRSDLYSLGCMLFELLTGRLPFQGEVGEIVGAHQHVAPPALRSIVPAVPRDVERLVAAMLAKSPADRPSSAAAVVAQIEELERRAGRASASRLLTSPSAQSRAPLQHTTLQGASGETLAQRRRGARRWVLLAMLVALAMTLLVVKFVVIDAATSTTAVAASAERFDTSAIAGARVTPGLAADASTVEAEEHDVPADGAAVLDAGIVDAVGSAQVALSLDAAGSRANDAETSVVTKRTTASSRPIDRAAAERAEAAARAGQWDKATQLATESISHDPKNVRALVVLGLAACKRSDAAAADTYLRRLPATKAAAIRSVCAESSAAAEVASGPQAVQLQYVDIYIETMPSGATLALDGKRVGTTPYRDRYAASGDDVEFQIFRVGYETARFTASAKQRIARNITLKRLPSDRSP